MILFKGEKTSVFFLYLQKYVYVFHLLSKSIFLELPGSVLICLCKFYYFFMLANCLSFPFLNKGRPKYRLKIGDLLTPIIKKN